MTVNAILEATAHILTAEGYEAANTNRIAELAGVSIGSLYQYFPNKEALITSLATSHAHEMLEMVESKLKDLSDAPIADVLSALVKACIEAHAKNPKLHKILNEQISHLGLIHQVENVEREIAGLLRSYLEKWRSHIKIRDLDLTVFILGHTVESLTHAVVIEHPELLSRKQFEQEITHLLLSYLGLTEQN
ncbi:MAG: TetR/AcrR family transcriptional regulator [Thermosynechococcaceae cyanobacterium]